MIFQEPEESPFQPTPTSPPQPPEDEDLLPFLPDLIPLDNRDTCAVDTCQFSGPARPHQVVYELLIIVKIKGEGKDATIQN